MDAVEIIRRYEVGVRFMCGCEERGLHPAVQRSLLDGRLEVSTLLKCPVHGGALEPESAVATA